MADLDELYKSLLGETKEESISLNDIIKMLKEQSDIYCRIVKEHDTRVDFCFAKQI